MLIFLKTSLFESPAQTLVNTVNTVGVMGKGIALKFKENYPLMFKEYKILCDEEKLKVGGLHLWRGPEKWVLNFPTKTTWRQSSKLDYIEKGLEKFVEAYADLGIRSISFPPLGCGNGNLDWDDVRPIMVSYLKNLPIDIYIHDYQVSGNFIPEHMEAGSHNPFPVSPHEFMTDIRALILKNRGMFDTIQGKQNFTVVSFDEEKLIIKTNSRNENIPNPKGIFEEAWSQIQNGLYTNELFSNNAAQKYKTYIFAILRELPYLQFAEYQHARSAGTMLSHALFVRANLASNQSDAVVLRSDSAAAKQMKLWE